MNLNEAQKILKKSGYSLIKKSKMNESIFALSIDGLAHRIIDMLDIDVEQTDDYGESNEGLSSYAIITANDNNLLKDLTTAINSYNPTNDTNYGFDPASAEFEGNDIYIPFDDVVDYDGAVANIKEVIRFSVMNTYKLFMKYDSQSQTNEV